MRRLSNTTMILILLLQIHTSLRHQMLFQSVLRERFLFDYYEVCVIRFVYALHDFSSKRTEAESTGLGR